MKCKNCGKTINLLEDYCDECKQVVMQEELNGLIEENKQLNKLENTKELDELSNLKEKYIEENNVKDQLKDIVKIEEEKQVKNNKNKIIIIVCIVSAIVIIMITIFLLLLNKNNEEEPKEKVINYKEVINKYGNNVKKIVSNLKTDEEGIPSWNAVSNLITYDEYKVECNIHEIYEDGNIYLNECKIDNKKIKYSYGKKQEEVEGKKINIYKQISKDNSIYYNTLESESLVGTITCKTMECEYIEAYENYVLIKEENQNYIYNYEEDILEYGPFDIEKDILISYENTLYALIYNNNNIYNFKTKKSIENLDGSFLAPEYGLNTQLLYKYGYVIFKNNSINNFINLRTGNTSYSINGEISELIESADKSLVYITTINPTNSKITIYNSNGKKLFNGDEYNRLILLEKNIIILNDTNCYTYDLNLNLEFSSKTYNKILDIYNSKYIAVIDNKSLNIVDFNDNVLATFDFIWDDSKYTFIKEMSKYSEADKKIILTIEQKNEDSTDIYEYYYNVDKKQIDYKKTSN